MGQFISFISILFEFAFLAIDDCLISAYLVAIVSVLVTLWIPCPFICFVHFSFLLSKLRTIVIRFESVSWLWLFKVHKQTIKPPSFGASMSFFSISLIFRVSLCTWSLQLILCVSSSAMSYFRAKWCKSFAMNSSMDKLNLPQTQTHSHNLFVFSHSQTVIIITIIVIAMRTLCDGHFCHMEFVFFFGICSYCLYAYSFTMCVPLRYVCTHRERRCALTNLLAQCSFVVGAIHFVYLSI